MIQACLKGLGQASILAVLHNMVHAQAARNGDSAVTAAVVNYQRFDAVDAVDSMGNICKDSFQCVGFVETGDLDNQFHGFVAAPPLSIG